TVRAAEYMMKLANHRRIALFSPKMRSKVGSIVARSSSVSFTSKTINGRTAMSLASRLLNRPYGATLSWPASRPSAQRLYPARDRAPDFVRRIFLDEMHPLDRHLGLRREASGVLEKLVAGEDSAGLGL